MFVLLAIMLFLLLKGPHTQATEISITDFKNKVEAGKVQSVMIETSDVLTGKLVPNEQIAVNGVQTPVTNFRVQTPAQWTNSWEFGRWLLDHSSTMKIEAEPPNNFIYQVILPFIPWLLIFGFVWFFIFRQLRSAGGANMLGTFGKSKAKITSKEHTNVTFDDVAGVE